MSIQQIIKEALEKSPLGVKEAVQEELRARVAEAISAKMEEVELGEAIRYSRSEALKKDKEHGFYADEDDGQYHVFGASTGYSYGQHDNKSSAEKHARELNKTHSPHIKESFDLSDYTLEELEDFMESEEYEQLDEAFASDYAGMLGKFKKSVDSAEAAHAKGNIKMRDHHLDNARSRLMGMKSTDTAKLKQSDHYDRYKKMRGISEDFEQIDELKKSTLASYVSKAADNAATHGIKYGEKKAQSDEMDRMMNRHMSFADKDKIRGIMGTTHKDVDAPREKAAKRLKGIDLAVKKLSK